MLNRTENDNLIADSQSSQAEIKHLQQKSEFASKLLTYGMPMYGLGMFGGSECLLASSAMAGGTNLAGLLLGTTAILTGTAFNLALVGGGLYGMRYHINTKEKQLIVQRLIDEINTSTDVETLLFKARVIKQQHSPYLCTERGFYGFTLAQQWVGNKYGHETGNTRSWLAVTAALEAKCSELAGSDVNNAIQKLHEVLSEPVSAAKNTL